MFFHRSCFRRAGVSTKTQFGSKSNGFTRNYARSFSTIGAGPLGPYGSNLLSQMTILQTQICMMQLDVSRLGQASTLLAAVQQNQLLSHEEEEAGSLEQTNSVTITDDEDGPVCTSKNINVSSRALLS